MNKLISNKKFKVATLLFLVAILLSFQFTSTFAESIASNRSVLESGKTLDGTGVFSGDIITIDGTVKGTTFAAGSKVDVTGVIEGDIFIAAQDITISGTVKGSVIAAANTITVTGTVENNIYSAGSTIVLDSQTNGSAFLAASQISLEKDSKIDRDVFIGGSQIFHRGLVGRSLFASSDNISIDGKVGKNAKLYSNDLYIEAGEIGGNLEYSSPNKATISNDSKIAGTTDWNEVEPQTKTKSPLFSLAALVSLLISIAGALIVWILIKLLRPNFWNRLSEHIMEKTLKTLGFGALALIVVPTAIFFLFISVVGVPTGMILTSMYLIAMYISRIIVAVAIGSWFAKRFNWKERHKGVWLVLLGLVILSVLGIIPIVNFIVSLIVILFGLGSIVLYAGDR